MTAPTIIPHPAARVSPDSIRRLASIEARRSLRRSSIWLGFATTIFIIASPTNADWPGGAYTEKLPQSFMPIILGAFIAAFRTGRRTPNTMSPKAPPSASPSAEPALDWPSRW